MNKSDSVQVGVVIDSVKAFDIYYEATGEPPQKIPDGCVHWDDKKISSLRVYVPETTTRKD